MLRPAKSSNGALSISLLRVGNRHECTNQDQPVYINLDPSKVDEMMAKRDLTFDEVLERSDPFTPLTKLTFERARAAKE